MRRVVVLLGLMLGCEGQPDGKPDEPSRPSVREAIEPGPSQAPVSAAAIPVQPIPPPPPLVVDETFGDAGHVLFEVGKREHRFMDAVVLPDGAVLVVGHASVPDGALDRSFGDRGVAALGQYGFGNALTLDAQGRILVVGHALDHARDERLRGPVRRTRSTRSNLRH